MKEFIVVYNKTTGKILKGNKSKNKPCSLFTSFSRAITFYNLLYLKDNLDYFTVYLVRGEGMFLDKELKIKLAKFPTFYAVH